MIIAFLQTIRTTEKMKSILKSWKQTNPQRQLQESACRDGGCPGRLPLDRKAGRADWWDTWGTPWFPEIRLRFKLLQTGIAYKNLNPWLMTWGECRLHSCIAHFRLIAQLKATFFTICHNAVKKSVNTNSSLPAMRMADPIGPVYPEISVPGETLNSLILLPNRCADHWSLSQDEPLVEAGMLEGKQWRKCSDVPKRCWSPVGDSKDPPKKGIQKVFHNERVRTDKMMIWCIITSL